MIVWDGDAPLRRDRDGERRGIVITILVLTLIAVA